MLENIGAKVDLVISKTFFHAQQMKVEKMVKT